jgi:tripartite ATP-independent transporter DctM subunit
MSPEIIGLISIAVLLLFLYGGMWVGFAMLFVGFWAIVIIEGWNVGLTVLATVPFRQVGNYTLASIPLFMLMGVVLEKTDIGSDMFFSAYKWFGQIKGGLAMAVTLVAAILGVVTDSLVAAITLGKVAMPQMRKYKYNDIIASSSIVAGASTASLIPPSVGFLLYAVLTGESAGKLFVGAIFPGIVLLCTIILIIYVWVKIKPDLAPAGPKTGFIEKISSLKYTWSVFLIILLIIGGIYAGIFTPTEAAAIGAFFSMVITFVSRRLDIKRFLSTITETAQMMAMMILTITGAFIFQTMITLSNLNFHLGSFITGLDLPYYLIMGIIILIYIVIGMFCDIWTGIVLTVPILYPVIISLGYDPIWFGVILVILIEMGCITPPIGMNIFMFSGVTGTPVNTIFKGIWPFVLAELICVVILMIFPQIVTFLPGTMR